MAATAMFTGVFPYGVGHTLFRTSSTTLYAVYLDSTSFVRVMKSTNNGTSWTQMDSTHVVQGFDSGIGTPSVWAAQIDSTGKIHVVYTSTLTLYKEIIFNTATDLWGTAVNALSLTSAVNQTSIALAIDKQDYPHITVISQTSTAFNNYYANKVGGTWNASFLFDTAATNVQFCDIIVDNNNIPIICANIIGTFWCFNGNTTNATSFTKNQVSTTSAGSGTTQISMVQDDLNNTWLAYAAVTSSNVTLQKHVNGDPWSTWSSAVTSGNAGFRIRMTCAGRNIYVFYQSGSTNSTIRMDTYNGAYWAGQLDMDVGSYNTPHPRYSNRNMFSPSTVDFMFNGPSTTFYYDTYAGSDTTVNYFFDASDAAVVNNNASWTNPALAFDSSLTTGANTGNESSPSGGYMYAEGTSSTTTGGPISQVRVRIDGQGNNDNSAFWSPWQVVTPPAAGWTWPVIKHLETLVYAHLGDIKADFGAANAYIYTDNKAEFLGNYQWTSIHTGPEAINVFRIDLEVTYVPYATVVKQHSTDAVKKIVPTSTHTTDTNKRKTNTRQHTTSSYKRISVAKFHTTNSNLKAANTRSHSTSSNLRKANITVTHTTDALRHTIGTKSHTTDALKRKVGTKTHLTDANILRRSTQSHTTDSLLRKTNTKAHTTSANKRVSGLTRTHSTDSLLRKQNIRSHSTNSYIQPSIGTLSTDYLDVTFVPVVVVVTQTHSTDSLKRKATLRSHTTDALVRKTNTKSHTTDSLKRRAITVSHTTNSLLRRQITKTHTTDALLRRQITKTHTTNSLLRKQNVRFHTTDANKRRAFTVAHSTDSNKRKLTLISHTTDALKRGQYVKTHTTDSLKRTQNVKTHTTNSLLRRLLTKTHTTDSFLRRQVTKFHTTDALKRKQNTVSHSTSANKRKSLSVLHTTDANKRKALTKTHTTDSLLRRQLVKSHTTDALKRVIHVLTHTTNSFLRKTNTRTHTTDALKRTQTTRFHKTDALKRKTNVVQHATDANKRRANLILTHATDALKRKANVISHSTSALLRKINTRSHSTDANKKLLIVIDHTTDSFLRVSHELAHFTDANKRRAYQVSHSTDTRVSTAHSVQHRTDATKWSRRGTKMVLVNGVWHYGVVEVLIGGTWHIAEVRYFNGTDWPLTEQ